MQSMSEGPVVWGLDLDIQPSSDLVLTGLRPWKDGRHLPVIVTVRFDDLIHAIGRNFTIDEARRIAITHSQKLRDITDKKIATGEFERHKNNIVRILLGTDDLRQISWDLDSLSVKGSYRPTSL